jgi:glutathione peroxidase
MTDTVYDFVVPGKKKTEKNLADYKGKVLLIVNTASKCGFTPQYTELEEIYEKYKEQGLEILDFPCNQFGQQAPEGEEEYHQFCQANYKTKFPQFAKIDVNGEKESPLFKWLKSKKGFAGFDPNHKITPILNDLLSKADPEFAKKPDIKWNFTKFLVDKEGHVVERFESTAGKDVLAPAIEAQLKK